MRQISVDLPDVREADERDVGHQLQLEPQPALLAASPCSANAGARRRFDRNRALPRPPRPPAAASQRSPWCTRSASSSPSRVARTVGALGHVTIEVVARRAVLLLALAVGAVVGPAVRVVAEGEQRGDVAVGDEPDVAALAAVAAVGPAPGHVRLAPERHAARAAVAASHVAAAHSSTNPAMAGQRRGWVSERRSRFQQLTRWTSLRYSTSRTGSPLSVAVHVVVSFGCAPALYVIRILTQQPVVLAEVAVVGRRDRDRHRHETSVVDPAGHAGDRASGDSDRR